jgi:hypothetical protein
VKEFILARPSIRRTGSFSTARAIGRNQEGLRNDKSSVLVGSARPDHLSEDLRKAGSLSSGDLYEGRAER